MRIAIIGAGIGGLVTALGLQNDGHEVVLFELRPEAEAAGAGLSLFGNSFAALDAVGAGDLVRSVSLSDMHGYRTGQRSPEGRWLVEMPAGAVSSLHTVHRTTLHRTLVGALAPGTLRTGVVASADPDGSPRVKVDGEVESFDLVVGADGLRSGTRAVLGLDTGLRYAGYTAWRGVTRPGTEILPEAGETWGRGRRFGVVPLPEGRTYWFAVDAMPAGVRFEDDRAAILERFANWHDPIPACITETEAAAILHHDIHDLARPLRSYVKARTVLLGDAAHAMTPDLGQGAGQAIEDAATLVVLLREAASSGGFSAEAVAHRYDAIRRPRANAIQRRSRRMGAFAQARGMVVTRVRDAVMSSVPDAVLRRAGDPFGTWPDPRGK